MLKHNASLLRAFEKRSWDKAESLFDAGYSDRWGHDRERVLRESREVLRQFFAVEISQERIAVSTDGASGEVQTLIRIKGSGTPLAQLAMQTVNDLKSPFRFVWKRKSWKPWDWQLTGVDNPDLSLPEGTGFY